MQNLCNPDYERALIGAILLDNRIIDELRVSPSLFETPLCRDAYGIILKTRARGAVATVMEVGMMMPDRAAEVAALTDIGTSANARYYQERLAELARKRGISKLSRDMAGMAHDESRTIDELFAYVDRALLEISEIREIGYKHVSAYGQMTMDEMDRAIAMKGMLTGIPTGFEGLDEKTNGLQPQSLVIIGARPGAGKTSIALNMASAALRAKVGVGFFSAEMSAPSILKRMLSDWSQVEYKRLNSGLLGSRDIANVKEAYLRLVETRLFLNDRPAIPLGDLVSDARGMKRREDVGVIFVDYLSLVDNARRDIPRHEQVAEISRTLKGLARELDVPIVVLSQLTREAQGERPKLSQLRDSGAVEQDADMVLLLWNQGYADEAKDRLKITLIVEKNRNGATGELPMQFKPQVMRFSEVEDEWQTEQKRRQSA